jgi:hypothetical protein
VENESTLQRALPGYEIGAELGRGAFGVVIGGRHRQLGRDVAIKVLTPGLVQNEVVRARFLAEARVLAALEHPHIVPVFDYVEQDEACILVMERLVGGTVWRRFVDRGFDQRTACAIALVACSGLNGAHDHGVLHRDMKPENMLFGAEGILKVGDFGIARVLGDDDALATREGEILGTPAYMAPEQASGSDLGPPTDVYATGVMLYELLSGRLPYPEEAGNLATVLRHINEDPTPLPDVAPSVPEPVSEVVMQALARDPVQRFATAEDFGVAIGHAATGVWGGRWLDGLPVSLREPGPILASAQAGPAAAAPATGGADPTVMRPSIDLHSLGAAGTGLAINDLMPLRQAPVTVPDFPKRLAGAAVLVGVLALLLGLLGVGSSGQAPSLGRGAVTVAGHDPTRGRVAIDLGRPIPIVVRNAPTGIGTIESAELTLSLGGVSIVHATSGFQTQGGALTTSVDASSGHYIVGGKLSGSLQLIGTNGTVTDHFGVSASSSPFTTFLGVVGLVIVLMVAAYTESLLRSLRRGRRRDSRTGAIAGLVAVGVFGGIGATLLGWMLEITGPNVVPFVLAAVVGAGAGLLAGMAGAQVGDRARALRQSRRLVLVARRSAMTAAPVGA